MKRLKRGAVCCAVSIIGLQLAGCNFNLSWLTVSIPDFQSKQVQGIWISRSSTTTGTFTHDMQVQIQVPAENGVVKNIVDSSGNQQCVAVVAQPDPANPDHMTVKIGVINPTVSGCVKVSTYNAVGESPLSDAEASL